MSSEHIDLAKRLVEGGDAISVDCPECKFMNGDDQYTCTLCWNVGGDGTIDVTELLKNIVNELGG